MNIAFYFGGLTSYIAIDLSSCGASLEHFCGSEQRCRRLNGYLLPQIGDRGDVQLHTNKHT